MAFTATITSRGQLTLPRAAREAINSSTVEIDVRGEVVILKAVRSVAGALSAYADLSKPISLAKAREKAWNEVARARKR